MLLLLLVDLNLRSYGTRGIRRRVSHNILSLRTHDDDDILIYILLSTYEYFIGVTFHCASASGKKQEQRQKLTSSSLPSPQLSLGGKKKDSEEDGEWLPEPKKATRGKADKA